MHVRFTLGLLQSQRTSLKVDGIPCEKAHVTKTLTPFVCHVRNQTDIAGAEVAVGGVEELLYVPPTPNRLAPLSGPPTHVSERIEDTHLHTQPVIEYDAGD